eukprot:gene6410-6641_t
MAETASSCVAFNGYSDQVHVLHRDGRFLKLGRDMHSPADLLVFEVFDCGLIGEGALHIVAAAKASHLLTPAAEVLPAAAKLAFEFDFNTPDPSTGFQPSSRQLVFCADDAGICNAVAFWFELQLDLEGELLLSTSPHQPSSQQQPTWKQAVQMLPECWVRPGQQLRITAQHDTYAISFTPAVTESNTNAAATDNMDHSDFTTDSSARAPPVDQAPEPSVRLGPQLSTVPLVDPVWKAAYDQLADLQSHLAKAVTQDPLEYRRLVTAATLLAMQPRGGIIQPSSIQSRHATGSKHAKMPRQPWTEQEEPSKLAGNLHEQEPKRNAEELAHHAADAVMSTASKAVDEQQEDIWPTADPHHAAAMLVRLFS